MGTPGVARATLAAAAAALLLTSAVACWHRVPGEGVPSPAPAPAEVQVPDPAQLLPPVPAVESTGGTVLYEPPEREAPRIDVVLEPYVGKYGREPAFWERVRELQDAFPRALAEVGERIGRKDAPPPRVRVILADTPPGPLVWGMTTRTEVRSEGTVRVVTVATEPLFAGTHDLSRTVGHEAAHCWQQEIRGVFSKGDSRWLEEGLALWVSGDGENEVRSLCSHRGGEIADVESLVRDEHRRLEIGNPGLAYAYLAVLRLHGMAPEGNGDRFLTELFANRSWKGTLQRWTGSTHAEFVQGLPGWATEHLRERLPHREEFLVAKRFLRAGDHAEAAKRFEAFAKEHPESVLALRALVEAAQCRFKRREFAASGLLLDRVRRASPSSDLFGAIAYYEFFNAFESGDRDRASSLGNAFLRDYCYLVDNARFIEKRLRDLER